MWFGPAPIFESCVVHSPSCVDLTRVNVSPVGLRQGVYELEINEFVKQEHKSASFFKAYDQVRELPSNSNSVARGGFICAGELSSSSP